MSAIRSLPTPSLPIADPKAAGLPGISAVAVLPCALVPHAGLAVNLMRTDPGGETMTHHHGELDTTFFVLTGTMAFHCGPGMQHSVSAGPGSLAWIAPQAVHAEYNPDRTQASLGITVRDTPGPFITPCEPPMVDDGGIRVIPAPSRIALTREHADPLAPLSNHHLRARRIALDRANLARGERMTSGETPDVETAIHVLAGTVALCGGGKQEVHDARAGSWWYVEPGTSWSTTSEVDAELLVIRVRKAS